jgi:hypothetical protein
LRTKKHAKDKKSCFLTKIFKNDGYNDVLGHLLPILDDASDPPRHRKTWASKILFFKLLVGHAALKAQAVGHVYCWVSILLPGPNPNFFGHQLFPTDLNCILARQLLKKFCTLKKVQLCGLLWWPLCAECLKTTFPDTN